MVNVVIEEFLNMHHLHQDTYDILEMVIRAHDGSILPTLGALTLELKVGPRAMDVNFVIIPA